jgi:hypothetical protein
MYSGSAFISTLAKKNYLLGSRDRTAFDDEAGLWKNHLVKCLVCVGFANGSQLKGWSMAGKPFLWDHGNQCVWKCERGFGGNVSAIFVEARLAEGGERAPIQEKRIWRQYNGLGSFFECDDETF